MEQFDVAVLGGGFYGCSIAIFLAEQNFKVALFEKENALLQKASSINQARVHGGYHYPRSFMTATRSLINYSRFTHDYRKAIIDEVEHIYAISRYGTKTSAKQFYNIFKKLGAQINRASSNLIREIFNLDLVEDAFMVNEAIFDWAILEKIMVEKLHLCGVKLFLNTEINNVTVFNQQYIVKTTFGEAHQAKKVFSCLYSKLNLIQTNSNLPLLPLKYELAELALVEPLPKIDKRAITIMDGQFFSLMPYPQKKLYTLSHVRYTPHESWIDQDKFNKVSATLDHNHIVSNYIFMKQDAVRYMPILNDLKYVSSLYEIKTIMQRNEIDDGRPILFREEPTLKNYFSVMGSKIDNVYDILDVISDKLLIKSHLTASECAS